MVEKHLTEDEARELVNQYMDIEEGVNSTQDIIDSGIVSGLKGFQVHPGKVSDSIYGGRGRYKIKETGEIVDFENPPLNSENDTPLRLMVRTARISTHDINRGDIPFKDQILAINHNMMRRIVAPYLGSSQIDVDGLKDNDVVIAAENIKIIPVENVFRAFMAKSSTSTSLYTHYMNGEREFCGHSLPENLIVNGPLHYVMDTPSTKDDEHDKSVSPQWLFDNKFCTPGQYLSIRNDGLVAFGAGANYLRQRGLLLVDTKFEHGINQQGEIVGGDEFLTMDSSRFWMEKDYNDQLDALLRGEISTINPKSFSKEFARGISKGDGGYSAEQSAVIATRYIIGIQHLTGKRFDPDIVSRDGRVVKGLEMAMRIAT